MRQISLASLVLFSASPALAWVPVQVCGGDVARWNAPEVPYRLNSSGSADLPFATVETAVANGWEAWTSPCCSAWRVRRDADTTVTATEQSAQHVISFEESDWDPALGNVSSVIGVTLISFSGNCAITDADIVFNGVGFVFVDGVPQGQNESDLQSIATHEQGHWLGLGHTTAGPTATMHDTYDNGIGQRTLHPDDEAGVCALYRQVESNCTDDVDDDCDGLVDCLDPDCIPEAICSCQPVGDLACGGSVSATTVGGSTFLDAYSCGGSAAGPEMAYRFQPTFDGEVTFSLSGLSTNLDLFVITNDCIPGGCVAQSVAGGTGAESVTIPVTADNTYNVVVDSVGAGGSFTLGLTCNPAVERVCNNSIDDDQDGDIDCADTDCDGETCGPSGAVCAGPVCACPGGSSPETVCDDQIDNDCDGRIDCADPDCAGLPCGPGGQTCAQGTCLCDGGTQVELDCGDGVDNDCDGKIDCADEDCLNQSCGEHGLQCLVTQAGGTCICPTGASVEFVCDDGADGDCDGLVDCEDPDCDNKACGADLICQGGSCVCNPSETPEQSCYDGLDNDCDGLIDCADPNCQLGHEPFCDNGIDDDCDGLVDCADPDCEGQLACGASNCDGVTIESSCVNGIDDDCDGDIDCDDADCQFEVECLPPESDCSNLLDDDGDGYIDCADSDCHGTPACPTPGDPNTPGDANPPGDSDAPPGGDADVPGDPAVEPPSCGCRGAGPADLILLLLGMGWTLRRRERSAPQGSATR